LIPHQPALRFLVLAGWLLATALAHAHAQPFQASAPLSWELKNARWFDGEKLQKGNLYVEHGVFTAKRPAKVNRKMDLRGQQVLINPLAEAHNHNLQTAWGFNRFAQVYLDEGVFYAQMLCGDPTNVAEVRALAALNTGPETAFVSACITSSDGYPLAAVLRDPTPEAVAAQKQLVIVDSPEQAQAQWPAIRARGGSIIRVVLAHNERAELRGVPEMFGHLGMSADTVATLTRLAHADGLRVAAHVESAADFDAAVAAGVDWIAHLPGYFNTLGVAPEQFLISETSAARAAAQHIAVITTLAATDLFKLDPEPLAALREAQRRNLERLTTAGVALLIGSDVFIGTARAEVHTLDALGVLPRSTILRLATRDTPRALFPKRRIGCFEPGCEASFLLLAGDPLADLAQIDMPLLRVMQGRLLTRLADVAAASAAGSLSTADPPARKKGKPGAATGKKAPAKPKAKRA
jgi:cytosine/adenosine deaminase-related metal-dependent hydrolase